MDKKYVTIKYTESYSDRYLVYCFGDRIPCVSEKKKADILHVFEISDSKTADNFNYSKGVFKKAFYKDLKVLCGANPDTNPHENFSLCIDKATGKHILMTISHIYELGNEVQPTIRKPSVSEERHEQTKNTKNAFNNLVKASFETMLKKYGAKINPYRFEDTKGNKRNYIALNIDYDELRKIIAAEISKTFGKSIKLVKGATSTYADEFAQLDVTQFFKENNN